MIKKNLQKADIVDFIKNNIKNLSKSIKVCTFAEF